MKHMSIEVLRTHPCGRSAIYSEMLFDWYEENGITNIGEEDSYDVEATENANPGGEADVFREAMERNGFV